MPRTIEDVPAEIYADVPNGWKPLVNELIEYLDGDYSGWTLSQAKEKFGGLRFYADPPASREDTKDFFDRIEEAENKSFSVCQECGEPGEQGTGPWIRTLCKKHDKGGI